MLLILVILNLINIRSLNLVFYINNYLNSLIFRIYITHFRLVVAVLTASLKPENSSVENCSPLLFIFPFTASEQLVLSKYKVLFYHHMLFHNLIYLNFHNRCYFLLLKSFTTLFFHSRP